MDPVAVKAIFTFQDFTHDLNIPDLSLHVVLGDAIKTVSLPYKEAVLIEGRDLSGHPVVRFQLQDKKGEVIGYAETVIPSSVFAGNESEGTQQLQFQLTKGREQFLTTSVYTIFIGRKLKKSELSKSKQSLNQLGLPKSSLAKSSSNNTLVNSEANSPVSKKQSEPEYEVVANLIQLNKPSLNIPNLDEIARDHGNIPSFQISLPTTPYNGRSTSPSKTMSRPRTITDVGHKKKSSLSMEKSSPHKIKADNPLLDKVKKLSEPRLTETASDDTYSPLYTEQPQTPTTYQQSQSILPSQTSISAEKQIPDIFATLEKSIAGNGFLKAHIEYLKSHLLAMDYKVTEVEVIQKDNEQLKKDILEAQVSKKKADERTVTVLNDAKQESTKLREQVASLIGQGTTLNTKNQELYDELIKAKAMISKLTLANTQKDNELSEAKAKNAELSETSRQFLKTKEALVRTELARRDDQKTFQKSLGDLKGTIDETKNSLEKASQEKRELATQLSNEKLAHQETRNELMILQRKLQNAEAYKDAIKSVEAQRDELLRQLADIRAERDEAHKMFGKVQENLNAKLKEFQAKELEYIQRVGSLEDEVRGSESKISALTFKLNKTELEVAQLNSKVGDLEQAASSYCDSEGQIAALKRKLAQAIEDRNLISKGVENMTANYKTITQRALDLEKRNEDLVKLIGLKEQEIDDLRDVITELESQPAKPPPKYVAVKDDPVDVALAYYLNKTKNGTKYRFMFTREAEGVYQFGSRKMNIKLENEKLLIRVGGGYTTIDEVLDVVAPAEYEKLIQNTKENPMAAAAVTTEHRKSLIKAAGLAKIMTKTPTSAEKAKNPLTGGRGSLKDVHAPMKVDLRETATPKRDSKGV